MVTIINNQQLCLYLLVEQTLSTIFGIDDVKKTSIYIVNNVDKAKLINFIALANPHTNIGKNNEIIRDQVFEIYDDEELSNFISELNNNTDEIQEKYDIVIDVLKYMIDNFDIRKTMNKPVIGDKHLKTYYHKLLMFTNCDYDE